MEIFRFTLLSVNPPLNNGLADPLLFAVHVIPMAGNDIIDRAPSIGPIDLLVMCVFAR